MLEREAAWCMVHFAPMRLRIHGASAAPCVVAQLRAQRSRDVSLFQVAGDAHAAVLLGDFGEDVGQIFGRRGGLPHCRAVRSIKARALRESGRP